jgi:hypothetical protein
VAQVVRQRAAEATRGSDAKAGLGPLGGRDRKAEIPQSVFFVSRKRATNRRDDMRADVSRTSPDALTPANGIRDTGELNGTAEAGPNNFVVASALWHPQLEQKAASCVMSVLPGRENREAKCTEAPTYKSRGRKPPRKHVRRVAADAASAL